MRSKKICKLLTLGCAALLATNLVAACSNNSGKNSSSDPTVTDSNDGSALDLDDEESSASEIDTSFPSGTASGTSVLDTEDISSGTDLE